MMRVLKCWAILSALLATPCLAIPDFKVGSVIIDEEITNALTRWLEQLFKTAGLKQYQPHVYLVVNPELNAAASTGGQIFIHTGLIQSCNTAAELLGVLAHEVGHIAGGHIAKKDQAIQEALLPAAAALLLGGAASLATGNPAPLIAGLSGGEHVFNRGMLKFTRTQESAADQAAMKYLDRLNWGSQGLLDFFKVMENKYQIFTTGLDPYSITHPLTIDRIKSVEDHLTHASHNKTVPVHIEAEFQRIRAKVIGFFESPAKILAEPDIAPQNSGPAPKKPTPVSKNLKSVFKNLSNEDLTYAKAIALYRSGKMLEAIQKLDSLIARYPDNPYFYELKGQIQFDEGKNTDAINSLETAVKKRPGAKYIKILLAHALLESKLKDAPARAKKILIPLTQQDSENTFAWRLLAIAYGKLNDEGQASLALAEKALSKGDKQMAKIFAKRAKAMIKSGPAAMRANDLLAAS